MHDALAPLLADGVIDEVVARLKSGKEADLWIVRHAGAQIAAKVYKSRQLRSFKNDAGYREGRQVRNTRTQRAMDRGTRFGQAAAEDAWKVKEADALHALHAAGVRVPRPVMFYEGVLLMELVLDAHGHPAPRLVDAHVGRERAAAMYADLRAQAIRMLACDLIHGDLSPYNVLVGAHGPVVIDFPQVVGAAHNSQAESFFVRDVENLRRFFASLDPALHAAAGDAREIWRAYVRRELTPDFVPSGREPPPAPRAHGGHGGHAAHQQERHPRPPGPHAAAGQRAPAGQHGQGGQPGAHGKAGRHGPPRERDDRGQHGQHAPRQAQPHPGGGRPAPAGPPGAPRQGGRGPGRGGPDRRRAAPAPEVVRIARPPLGGPGGEPRPPGAETPHARPAPPHAHPAPDPGAQPHRRRRRRRGARRG